MSIDPESIVIAILFLQKISDLIKKWSFVHLKNTFSCKADQEIFFLKQ